MDLDNYAVLKGASILVITGHSEYWTMEARRNFDRFVNEGKDAVVLSGNTMWWQVRYNETRDQLLCYRTVKEDPEKQPKLKTINWNDILLNYSILSSLGADFSFAGYGLRYTDRGWDGYKIASASPLLEGTTLKKGDITKCPSIEVDGAPLYGFNSAGQPIINRQALGFERIELIGYDYVLRGGVEGVATWIVFKKTKTSGTVINTASMNWCSLNGMGANTDLQKITGNMISKLLKKEKIFTPQSDPVELVPVN
jgi:hypothetical protein